jgi:hypothetical protein
MTTPPKKKLVPLSLCRWKKKENVLLRPMMRERPVRNSSCRVGRRDECEGSHPLLLRRQGLRPGAVWQGRTF